MRFRECFTVDAQARGTGDMTFRETIHTLVFHPGYRLVAYYRVSWYLQKVRFAARLARLLSALIRVRICRNPGVEIRARAEIGPGLVIFHPHDIVIGVGCRIGRNVSIYNGVTLGARTLQDLDEHQSAEDRYPTIEDGVTIFAGAKILGPVVIGRNSIVGANAVVNQSFPENSIIAGIPARLVGRREPDVIHQS